MSNINIYFYKYTLPIPVPEGHKETLYLHLSPNCWHGISNIIIYIQLNYTPQIVGSLYPIKLDILQKCTLCARRAHRNPTTYIHPPIVSMVYQISTYIFNCHIPTKLLASYIQYKFTSLCTLPQKPSILDSSHICCHDTANINVQCTLYNVQCTTDIYSSYCDAFVHFTFHNNLKLECIMYIES